MEILLKIKEVINKNDGKFKKSFSKLWGHSGGWLSFSCPHGIVYYLKFLLRAESCRDYVDGLSLKHQPNILIVDIAHIVANHANNTREEDNRKYGKANEEGRLIFPYEGHVASSDDSESIRLSKEKSLEVNFPWMSSTNKALTKIERNVHPITGSEIHLCLFDRFHEGNSASDIEYFRKINNIPQLNSVVSSQVQEQLHLRFDKNKSFLNMMKPTNYIFLFRSIINYYKIKKNSLLLKKLQQQIPLPIAFDIYGRAIYEINSKDDLMKKSSSENVEDCSSDNQGPLSDEEPLSPYISSYASSLSNSEPFSYTPNNLTDHFDAATDELWPVAYSLSMAIGDKRQILVDALLMLT